MIDVLPDPVELEELPRPNLPRLGFWLAVGWLAWLRFGTRSNPPIPCERFRTGLTFAGVRDTLKREQDAAYRRGEYMFVSRATVLGRMHQSKREQYARYLDRLADGATEAELEELEAATDPQGDPLYGFDYFAGLDV